MTLLTAFWLSWQSHTFFVFFRSGWIQRNFRAPSSHRAHLHAADAKDHYQWIHGYVY